MIIKLFLIIGVILLYLFLGFSHAGRKKYYFITVVFLLIRELDVPYLGDVTPVGVMTALIFIGTFSAQNKYLAKWGGYFLYLLFSLVIAYSYSPYSFRAFDWAYTLFVVMALAVIPPFLFDDEKDLIKLTRCVIYTCLVFSLATIGAYYGLADGTIVIAASEVREVVTEASYSRIYGLTNTNMINCVCAISMIFLPFVKLKNKWVVWFIVLVTIYGALLTLKRMTIIALVLSLFLFVIEQPKRGKYWTFFVVAIIVIVFTALFGAEMAYRFGITGIGGNEIEDSSTLSRLSRNEIAYEAIRESPLLGNGAGYVVYIHNGFLEVLGNCGIIGSLFIILRFIPSWKEIKKLNPWALAIVVFLITIFMLESAINHIQVMGYLGVFLGGYYVSQRYNWKVKR